VPLTGFVVAVPIVWVNVQLQSVRVNAVPRALMRPKLSGPLKSGQLP
jgi:hypothetical protein